MKPETLKTITCEHCGDNHLEEYCPELSHINSKNKSND